MFPPENPEDDVFVVHKAIKDLSLQEASAEDIAFREGNRNSSFLTTVQPHRMTALLVVLGVCALGKQFQEMTSKSSSCFG